ncbi:opioid-binding protein/cell adhesion molecule homolog [Littorina saxatilis]|uniref:opioid-binding protein/cell adhesion molecule homolog n=1 Tax=Littorina saxatilis TaxID=31220 RepID=UPI0038B5CB45
MDAMVPTFDSPMANVTVKEGATAVLPCSVKFLGSRQVVWTDQWSTLLTFEDRRIIDDERVSVERPFTKDWNLHIRDVQHRDQGLYNCQINTKPVKIKTVHLTVQVPAKIVDEFSSEDKTPREGETVTLVCNVTGIPMPKVTWFRHVREKDGAETQSEFCPEHHNRTSVGISGEVLIIHNISRYCGDIYECVAFNGVPPAINRMIQVDVQFPPEISLPNRRIGQTVGKETILECQITANPQANVKWLRQNGSHTEEIKTVPGRYRVELYSEDKDSITLSLILMYVSKEDFGTFICEASSVLGQDRESMVLYDYDKHLNSKTTTTTPTTSSTTTSTSTALDEPRRAFASQGLRDSSGAQIRIFTQGPTQSPPHGAQQLPSDGDSPRDIAARGRSSSARTTSPLLLVTVYILSLLMVTVLTHPAPSS